MPAKASAGDEQPTESPFRQPPTPRGQQNNLLLLRPPEHSLRADARRNREAVLDAASELFARRGESVQMDKIAERAGLGVGTLYRHFTDKQALRAAIIGRRFEAMTSLARTAEQIADPWTAFETPLY